MKLKKIASLALAGIMAVSMLAGCKNGESSSTDDSQNTQTTVDTSIVGVLNTAIVNNKAGISFTSNADFTSAVEKAVAEAGIKATEANIKTSLKDALDIGTSKEISAKDLMDASATDPIKAVEVYVVSGKKETAISAAYQKVGEIAQAVNSLDKVFVDSAKYEVTYSDAYATMLERTIEGVNYYVIAVGLTSEVEKA